VCVGGQEDVRTVYWGNTLRIPDCSLLNQEGTTGTLKSGYTRTVKTGSITYAGSYCVKKVNLSLCLNKLP